MKSAQHSLLVEFLDYLDANEHLKLPTADWDDAVLDFLFQCAMREPQTTKVLCGATCLGVECALPAGHTGLHADVDPLSPIALPVNLEPSPHRVLKVLTGAPTPPVPTAEDLERIRRQADAWHEAWKKQNAAMMSEPGRATAAAPPVPQRRGPNIVELAEVLRWYNSRTVELGAENASLTEQRDKLVALSADLLMALHEAEMTTPDGPGHMSRIVTLQLAKDALCEAVKAHSIAKASSAIAAGAESEAGAKR